METFPASDRSLLVRFGERINLETHGAVVRLTRCLAGVRGIVNLHPAYASVLVEFDPRRLTHGEVEAILGERFLLAPAEADAEPRRIEIPVRFGGECGPDLGEVARHTGLKEADVVERFAAAEYVVYFVGFATFFPYLGGLPEALATPRLAAPRTLVPAGSVAIGGAQAGIYPMASPGGWRLIGRTAMPLFDRAAAPPALLRMGDRIRFVPARESAR